MKANELRIGNWLRSAGSTNPGSPPRYFEVNADDIVTISEGHSYAQPIPLTPEILEMAGFKKDTFGYTFNYKFSLYYNHKLNKGVYGPYWKEFAAGEDILYLHQLQNVFHALTATELDINLNKEDENT